MQAAEQIRWRKGLRPLTGSLQSTKARLRTLEGHAQGLKALVVLADGRLASGSRDKSIRIWESRDRRSVGFAQFMGTPASLRLLSCPMHPYWRPAMRAAASTS